MQIVLISFVVIAVVVLLMAVGVIMGRKPVQGSCGGLNQIAGMDECELCGGDRNKCDAAADPAVRAGQDRLR